MGYACPVCDEPQVDARHLANHLAFTALLGDDDHETWLEEHAPGWEQEDDEGLAETVVEHATAVDLPDAAGHDHASPDREDVGRGRDIDRPGDPAGGGHDATDDHDPGVTFDDFGDGGPTARSDPALDADAKDVLREAYEMTRIRREREEKPDDADAGETE